MIDHLQHGALDPLRVEGEDAEDDHAHVTDADVGKQPLEIFRDQRL